MSTHLAAYFQSVDSATLTPIAVVVDDILTRPAADRFQVPTDYKTLHAAAALGPNLTRAQITTPSLEVRRETLDVIPHERGASAFTANGQRVYVPARDVDLEGTENIQFQASEDGAGATALYGLIWLKAPGVLPPMPDGDIRMVRATAGVTLTPNAWTTVSPTLEKDLQPGTYSLVGFFPSSANIIAARALFTGQNYRPGMIGIQGAEAVARNFDPEVLGHLHYYNMGSFAHTNVPQFQFLATAADTSEAVVLYVIRTGGVAGTP